MTAPTTIHLLQRHRHAGRDWPAGAPLTLPQRKAAWLIGIGVATAAQPAHLADMTPNTADVGALLVGARRAGRKSKDTTETATE